MVIPELFYEFVVNLFEVQERQPFWVTLVRQRQIAYSLLDHVADVLRQFYDFGYGVGGGARSKRRFIVSGDVTDARF